jgi:hypothetical protein
MHNLLTCTPGLAAWGRAVSSDDIFVLINWTVRTNQNSLYWRYCFADYIKTLTYHWPKHNLIHNWNIIATPSDCQYINGLKRIFEHCSHHNSQSLMVSLWFARIRQRILLTSTSPTCALTSPWRHLRNNSGSHDSQILYIYMSYDLCAEWNHAESDTPQLLSMPPTHRRMLPHLV